MRGVGVAGRQRLREQTTRGGSGKSRWTYDPWMQPCCDHMHIMMCVPVQDPVFRELYSEKRVVAEERQLRLESSPMGK